MSFRVVKYCSFYRNGTRNVAVAGTPNRFTSNLRPSAPPPAAMATTVTMYEQQLPLNPTAYIEIVHDDEVIIVSVTSISRMFCQIVDIYGFLGCNCKFLQPSYGMKNVKSRKFTYFCGT
jgi:hypothetical protein